MHLDISVQAHAAAFLGRRAWEVRDTATLLADAHRTAWSCYRQRTLLPGNDALTLEAEAFGARVRPDPEGDAWTVEAPLLGSLAQAAALPAIDAGAPGLTAVLGAVEELRATTSAHVAVPLAGPITLATQLVGHETLVRELHEDPFGSREHLLAMARKLRPWMEALAAAGAGVVVSDSYSSHDDIEPEVYSGLVAPALAWLVNEAGVLCGERPVLAVTGDVTPVAYKLFAANAGVVVCPPEARRSRFFPCAREFPGITVRLDLPASLWKIRDWHEVCQEIAAARAAARHHPNTILGTGPLPVDASSVLVVDASHFTASLDEWAEA